MSESNTTSENIQKESFHYDAFISYRHLEPDSFIAGEIHKMLEKFKLPHNVNATLPNGNRKITRVFRDEEELPLVTNLEEPLIEALRNSEFLIVICSPKLKESEWCMLEIRTFIEMHGPERVLAVMADGDPADIFPEELLSRKIVKLDAEGNPIEIQEHMEPLAADCRGKDNNERKKMMKSQILKLIAAMYSVNYDTLRRRHREQSLRRTIAVMALVAIVFLAFGLYSFVMMINLKHKNNTIEEQKISLEAANAELDAAVYEQSILLSKSYAEQSLNYLNECRRIDAIEYALKSIEKYNEETSEYEIVPYSADSVRALSDSLGVYWNVDDWYPSDVILFDSTIEEYKASPDGTTVVARLTNGTLHCYYFDKREQENIYNPSIETIYYSDIEFDYASDNQLLYYNREQSSLCLYDFEMRQSSTFNNGVSDVLSIKYFGEYDKIAVCYEKNSTRYLSVYEGATMNEVITVQTDINTRFCVMALCDTRLVYCDGMSDYFSSEECYCDITVVDIESGMKITSLRIDDYSQVNGVELSGDYLFCSLNRISGELFEAEDYSTSKYSFRKYDISTGELCWETEKQVYSQCEITYVELEEGYSRVILVYMGIVEIIDGQYGATVATFSPDNGMGDYMFNNGYMLIFGLFGGVTVQDLEYDSRFVFDTFHTYDMTFNSLKYSNGYIVASNSPNSSELFIFRKTDINRYSIESGTYSSDGDLEALVWQWNESYSNDDILSDATDDLGISSDNLYSVVRSEDGDKYLTFNIDGTLDFYKEGSDGYELISTNTYDITSYSSDTEFLGEDIYGNMYVQGFYGGGLVINPYGEVIGDFSYLCGLTEDKRNLVVYVSPGSVSDPYYVTIKIYTEDELIQMAEAIILY